MFSRLALSRLEPCSVGNQRGYGLTVIVDIGHGFTMLYAHLTSASVAAGDVLGTGEELGILGQTGNAWGQDPREAHLHFEVRRAADGARLNPTTFLNTPCPWELLP